MQLEKPLASDNGRIRLQLRAPEAGGILLEAAHLVAVDHPEAEEILVREGRLVAGERVPVWRVRSAAGADLTAVVSRSGGSGYEGAAGEVLLLDLVPPVEGGARKVGTAPARNGGLAWNVSEPGPADGSSDRAGTDVSNEPRASRLLVEEQQSDGSWVACASQGPLVMTAASQVRMRFLGAERIRDLARVQLLTDEPRSLAVTPVAATHTQEGDVLQRIGSGSEGIELMPGDVIDFEFEPPAPVEGKVRDYFFEAEGLRVSTEPTERGRQLPVPQALELGTARSNPATGVVRIEFALPNASDVRITVFDVKGRLVRELLDDRRATGRHWVEWNLRDGAGDRVSRGVYFYRMDVGAWQQARKLVVAR